VHNDARKRLHQVLASIEVQLGHATVLADLNQQLGANELSAIAPRCGEARQRSEVVGGVARACLVVRESTALVMTVEVHRSEVVVASTWMVSLCLVGLDQQRQLDRV